MMHAFKRASPLPGVHEAARIAAVQTYMAAIGPAEPFEAVVRIAAEALQAPVALLSLMGEQRQEIVAAFGANLPAIPRALAICDRTIASTEGCLAVPDLQADPRFQEHPMVWSAPEIRFYAGVCLIDRDGYAIGTLCVMASRPGRVGDITLPTLRGLAQQAVDTLARQRAEHDDIARQRAEHDDMARQRAEHDGLARHRASLGPAQSATPCWLGVRSEFAVVPCGRGEGRRLLGVAANSPADRAGLRAGDIVTAIEGRATRRRNDLMVAIGCCSPGDVVSVEVWRGRLAFDRAVRLERVPEAMQRRRVG